MTDPAPTAGGQRLVTISVHVSEALRERLTALATQQGLSLGEYAHEALVARLAFDEGATSRGRFDRSRRGER